MMGLAEKMFSKSSTTCPLRSDCNAATNRKFFDTLFADDWEVFVIKRDDEKGGFDWFTLCCEAADAMSVQQNIFSAACR